MALHLVLREKGMVRKSISKMKKRKAIGKSDLVSKIERQQKKQDLT